MIDSNTRHTPSYDMVDSNTCEHPPAGERSPVEVMEPGMFLCLLHPPALGAPIRVFGSLSRSLLMKSSHAGCAMYTTLQTYEGGNYTYTGDTLLSSSSYTTRFIVESTQLAFHRQLAPGDTVAAVSTQFIFSSFFYVGKPYRLLHASAPLPLDVHLRRYISRIDPSG
jgi:hypothetical protein